MVIFSFVFFLWKSYIKYKLCMSSLDNMYVCMALLMTLLVKKLIDSYQTIYTFPLAWLYSRSYNFVFLAESRSIMPLCKLSLVIWTQNPPYISSFSKCIFYILFFWFIIFKLIISYVQVVVCRSQHILWLYIWQAYFLHAENSYPCYFMCKATFWQRHIQYKTYIRKVEIFS